MILFSAVSSILVLFFKFMRNKLKLSTEIINSFSIDTAPFISPIMATVAHWLRATIDVLLEINDFDKFVIQHLSGAGSSPAGSGFEFANTPLSIL